jgi:hypothetical protein
MLTRQKSDEEKNNIKKILKNDSLYCQLDVGRQKSQYGIIV